KRIVLTCNELESLVRQGVVRNPRTGQVVVDLVSIGLHLDNQFLAYEPRTEESPVTPPQELPTRLTIVSSGDTYILPPGGKILACSEEVVAIPNDLMAFIQTKGSLARGFLTVHMCDAQIEPGYQGKITLEIVNFSDFSYELAPGMPIAQLFFVALLARMPTGYCGRYQGAMGPTAMRSPSVAKDCSGGRTAL
ncbi:MAG: dCTP deaminase, partial [Bacillota bacterium]|nr:dCTP deaminase [Bacillota bacterium]